LTSLLGETYINKLPPEKKSQVDLKAKKCREQFSRGFQKSFSVSLTIYSLFTLTNYFVGPAKISPLDSLDPEPGSNIEITTFPKIQLIKGGEGAILDKTTGKPSIAKKTIVCEKSIDFYLGLAVGSFFLPISLNLQSRGPG